MAGLGVVLLPQELVHDALRKGTLLALLPGYTVPASPMNLLYAADRRVTPKVRSFVDFAKGAFGRDLMKTAP